MQENGKVLVSVDDEIKIGEWILTLLISAIPIVNIIMMFVWGFGSNVKQSKANFCKANLIMIAIIFVISILVSLFFMTLLGAVVSSMY